MLSTELVRWNHLLRDAVGWGVALWLVGYILGVILFPVLPTSIIGWFIMPIGVVLTIWVLVHKIEYGSAWRYAIIGLFWTAIAIGLDYVFIVRLFKPEDGYYKLDVYLYYILTFLMPSAVGLWRSSQRKWRRERGFRRTPPESTNGLTRLRDPGARLLHRHE